jgi:hypothetical protein
VTKALLITRPPLLHFGKIERPTFDEIPDAQPAAILNVTAGYAPALAFVNRLARRDRIQQSTETLRKLIAIMALGLLLCLFRGCRPWQT